MAAQALDSYMATMDPTRKLVVVTYVGVWVKVSALNPDLTPNPHL